MEEHIVATVDIGSSKIVAMAARKMPGQYNIIASETQTLDVEDQTKALVKRGLITDISLLANIIAEILRKLNKKIEEQQLRLEKIYIGYGGQGLHTKICPLELEVDGVIDMSDIDLLKYKLDEHPDHKNIRRYFHSYFLDGKHEKEPVGKTCSKLECRYLLLTGHVCEQLRAKIEERTGGSIKVEEILVSPEATAYAVLEDNERKEGCALVEIGAGITTVSIYHGNELKFLNTIPLGGLAITKDICSLKIPFAEAENHKIKNGDAQKISKDKINIDNPTEEEKLKALNNIIAARVKEIAVNVHEQIIKSRLAEHVQIIVITGGSSSLSGLEGIFGENTDRPVRTAIPRRTFVKQDSGESLNPANSAVVGMFAMAKEICCKHINPIQPPATPAPPKEPAATIDPEPVQPEPAKTKSGGFWATIWDNIGEAINQSETYISPEEKEKQRQKQKESEAEAALKKAAQAAERERITKARQEEKLEKERRKKEEEERKQKEREAKVKQPGIFDKLDKLNNKISEKLFEEEEPINSNKINNNSNN
jgi:cell division protein FtsA